MEVPDEGGSIFSNWGPVMFDSIF